MSTQSVHADPKAAGPVALVTGAGRRLGNVIARELAANGYNVALHCLHSRAEADETARELTSSTTQPLVVVADLRDENATRAMVRQVHARFGRLDALVNN